jgi:hypothetical protein
MAETPSIEVAAMWFGFRGDFPENFHGRIDPDALRPEHR